MSTVWFIRHAESEANAGLPSFNPARVGLTARGSKQARQIALSFQKPPDLIITSPYMRTQQTAEPTLQRFPHAHHEEWPVHEFTYLTRFLDRPTTIFERRPMVNAFWERSDPFYTDGEGAESFVDFMHRAQDIVQQLKRVEEDFIAIFSHEQFIRAIFWTLLINSGDPCSETMERFRSFLTSFSMPNGSILKVQLQEDEDPWFSKIITSHLS